MRQPEIRWIVLVEEKNHYAHMRYSDSSSADGAVEQFVHDEPAMDLAGATARVWAYEEPNALYTLERAPAVITKVSQWEE